MQYQEIRACLDTEPFWEVIPDGPYISALIPSLFDGKVCDCVFLYGRTQGGTAQGPYRRILFDPEAKEVLAVQECQAPQTLEPKDDEAALDERKSALALYEELYPAVRELFARREGAALSAEEKQQISRFLWALYRVDAGIYPWYALVAEEFFAWATAGVSETKGR